MDVAELNAHLKAEVGGFLRNLEAADGGMDDTRRNIKQLEAAAQEAGRVLNDIRVSQAQAYESKAALEVIERSVSSVSHVALLASEHLNNVKVSQAQATETKVTTDQIKASLDSVIAKAVETRLALRNANGGAAGGRGGSDDGGLLAGILPGGARARPAALAVLAAGALSTMPTILPGALGLSAGAAGAAGALAGELGAVALALHGITAEAFQTQKAYDALDGSQKQLVDDLRSAGAGIGSQLGGIARSNVLPGISSGLHEALSPSTTRALTADVTAMASATGRAADEWGRFLGGPFGTEFGELLQRDAGYIGPLNDEIQHMLSFVTQLLNVGGPFTDWFSDAVDTAARGADEWAHSAAGVHDLGVAFDEAKSGLRALADVGGAFLNVLSSIYQVTESGANPAVEILAGLLNEIATIISENEGALSNFFEGAVTSAHDILAVIEALNPLVHGLVTVVDAVADELGGWRTVIDAVAIGFVARLFAMKLGVDGVIAKILLIGPSTTGAVAEADAALATLTAAAAEASAALAGIGPAAAEGAAGAGAALAGVGAEAATVTGEVGALEAGLVGLSTLNPVVTITLAVAAGVGLDKLMQWAGSGITQAVGHGTKGEKGGTLAGDPPGDNNFWTNAQWDQYFKNHGIVRPPAQTGATHGPGRAHTAAHMFGQNDVYGLLVANGVPADIAANLATISAHGEDPSGNPAALNNNPKTGDLSLGLFQENFFGKLGPARVAQFAPQFGKPGDMSVSAFLEWLGKNPDAQAKIAYQIYQSQGYGAWTTAKGLGITDAGSAFGVPPPLAQTPAKKKAALSGLGLLPSGMATALENAAAAAAAAGGTGGGGSGGFSSPADVVKANQAVVEEARKALDYLNQQKGSSKELLAIAKERVALEKEIATASGHIAAAQKQQKQDAMADKERGILGIGSSGAAATPSVLALRAQASALSKEIMRAAGDGLDVVDVRSQLGKLQRVLKFEFIPPDVRQAVSSQIAELKQTISQGMADALSAAKEALATSTSDFESGFSQVNQAADQAFQANVSAHVQQMQDSLATAVAAMQVMVHGPFGDFLFGGPGAVTPARAALNAMQDAHTQAQLAKNLKDAQDAVASAQGGNGNIFDRTTGITTTIPGDQSAVLNAQQQLADAQYAVDQYNAQKKADLEDQAAQDQLQAAQDAYTKQQQAAISAYQSQQLVVQAAMDQQVTAIVTGMESGAISAEDGMARIKKIWSDNGIDLGALSFALGGQIYVGLAMGLAPIFDLLETLMQDLGTVLHLSGDASTSLPQVSTSDDYRAALAQAAATHQAVAMAGGGIVTSKHYLVDAATGMVTGMIGEAGDEGIVPMSKMRAPGPLATSTPVGGGGDTIVNVNFNGDVYGADADELVQKLTPKVRSELLKTKGRNANQLGLS